MTRKRLLFYCDSLVAGGFELVVGRLITVLAESGKYEIDFWYFHERIAALARHSAIQLMALPQPRTVRFALIRALNPFAIRRLAAELRAHRADLVVICQSSIEVGSRGLLAGRLAGIPVVSDLAVAADFRDFRVSFGAMRDRLHRMLYRIPKQFIVLSEYQRALVASRVDVPVHVIPMTILGDSGPPRSKERGEVLEIGVAGLVMFPVKGQDVLPALVEDYRARGRRVKVHVIGDGPDLPVLRALIEARGLGEWFVLHGQLPYGAPAAIMRTLDVFVVPSRAEGAVPLVAFEALAAGAPIAVNRLASMQEWNIPPALIFDRDDTGDMIRAIDAAVEFSHSPDFQPFRERMHATVSDAHYRSEALRVFAELTPATP